MEKSVIKVLFVCESCVDRCKTFEKHFNKKLQDKGNIEVIAKGTQAYYEKDQLNEKDVMLADEVYCMTHKQLIWIKKNMENYMYNITNHSEKFQVIGVDNDYSFEDKELLDIVKEFSERWLIDRKNIVCNNCKNISYWNYCVEVSFGYPSNFDGETYKFCSDECLKHWVSKNIK